jgi:import receptor subunit TOM6
MSGRVPTPKQESTFDQIKKMPAFTVAVNVGLFVAGVAFIQSPLMDMLVPQL